MAGATRELTVQDGQPQQQNPATMKRVHFGSRSSRPTNGTESNHTNAQDGLQFASPDMPAGLVRVLQQLQSQSLSPQQQARKGAHGIKRRRRIDDEHVLELWERIKDMERKAAWDMAMEMDAEYPCSLIIPFLHSVDGNPKRAAKAITRHFEAKLDLFGREKLVKPIELVDLNEDDREALDSGGFQVLPGRDNAGRPIMFASYSSLRYKDVKNLIRALFYMWCTMVEDEEHQKSGIVAIGFKDGGLADEIGDYYYNGDDTTAASTFDHDMVKTILAVLLSVPVRPMGFHICLDCHSNQWDGIFDMVVSNIGKVVSQRIRCHYGTMQENMSTMNMAHGIPAKAIPVTREGETDLSNHKLWIEHRIKLEAQRRKDGMYIASSWGHSSCDFSKRPKNGTHGDSAKDSGTGLPVIPFQQALGVKIEEYRQRCIGWHNIYFSALTIPIISCGLWILFGYLTKQCVVELHSTRHLCGLLMGQ